MQHPNPFDPSPNAELEKIVITDMMVTKRKNVEVDHIVEIKGIELKVIAIVVEANRELIVFFQTNYFI